MKISNDCLIGLDLGTSAIKGVLISADGKVLAREKEDTLYDKNNNGYVVFDAEEFYLRVVNVIKKLTESLVPEGKVKGISMASASGNTLLTDESGKPLMPAISWMDTRVDSEIEKIFKELDEEKVYKLVGWPVFKMFPLAHLAWLKYHRPELIKSAARICMTTDYINYRLTGNWGIDSSTATTFYLQDQVASRWHNPFLKVLGISEDKLPVILPTGSILGEVTENAAALTGLLPGTPVVLGAFDHPCAARGAGVLEEGNMLLSCGTSWVGFYPVRDRDTILSHGMIVDPFLQPDGPWGAMFSIPSIGAKVEDLIVRWISDKPDRYRQFDQLAKEAEPGADGLFINLMQSEWQNQGNYTKQDIARAIMEGTAFLLKLKMESLNPNKVETSCATIVGGPSETQPWPQIICDMLGIKLDTVYGSSAGAVGAAILAGIGGGLYDDVQDAKRKMQVSCILRKPDKNLNGFYNEQYKKFKKRYSRVI